MSNLASDTYNPGYSIKGDRSMSKSFIAQYAAEAALCVTGVANMDRGFIASLKDVIGGEHVGQGVKVEFGNENTERVNITVYPIVYYGQILPEIAWDIQEKVKVDVENFTGLIVDSVDVQIMGVVEKISHE